MNASRIGAQASYTLTPEEAVMVGVDFQQAFGDQSWEHVPHAQTAVDRFREATAAWRSVGGRVLFVHTTYVAEDAAMDAKAEKIPTSRAALMEGSPGAAFYPDLVQPEDILVRKLGFSATTGSDLLDILDGLDRSTVILGGLTTTYCVQATADGINLAGKRVAVLSDACASQPVGRYSAEEAHDFAIARMDYLVGQTLTVQEFLEGLRQR